MVLAYVLTIFVICPGFTDEGHAGKSRRIREEGAEVYKKA
jgi:hypothetical protein